MAPVEMFSFRIRWAGSYSTLEKKLLQEGRLNVFVDSPIGQQCLTRIRATKGETRKQIETVLTSLRLTFESA
ncbi:MAG: hypothetical protein PHE68_00345 [Candidatus Peribacteraceae bacterium]|nr:hypothetical protein [Candidatus Peribacteraceae bacterium]MDD5074446.1 hypothetical protein [Candidatus Peribacteraceae bacterium]